MLRGYGYKAVNLLAQNCMDTQILFFKANPDGT